MLRRIVMLCAFALALASVSSAYAAGWLAPTADPHGGYLTTTKKCAVCHAVHEAETNPALNGEKLLRTSVVSSCDYCHVNGPYATTLIVYGGDPAKETANSGYEHTLGATRVPDSADMAGDANPANDFTIAGGLRCDSCHSVHAANTIVPGINILKANPNPSNPGTATTDTEFCADCHSNNRVTAKDLGGASDQVSHYMGVVTSTTVADLSTGDCYDCHIGGDGSASNSYPHYTSGQHFLRDDYTTETPSSVKLDGVCLDCHSGVGIRF